MKPKNRVSPLVILAAVLAVIALVVGVYTTFFESKGFEKATATIVSVEEDPDSMDEDDPDHIVTVEYDVDGQHYTSVLDYFSGSMKPGKTVDIRYNPENPAEIHGGQGFGIYLICVGVAILAVILFSRVRTKQKLTEQQETYGETTYAPSVQGEERELYFLTDLGTMKFGHQLEDAQRHVLYEAKVTKYNVMTPIAFDFIDHVHTRTTPHLIGHSEASEWDTLLIDNHYTFTFDGEDVWKHLKRNGVRMDREQGTLLWPRYHIFRDNEEIAVAETSSRYVHEEDAEQHSKLSKVPAMGFFRVWTKEENLDLLFVALLAFARTEASEGDGGTAIHSMIFGKKQD